MVGIIYALEDEHHTAPELKNKLVTAQATTAPANQTQRKPEALQSYGSVNARVSVLGP